MSDDEIIQKFRRLTLTQRTCILNCAFVLATHMRLCEHLPAPLRTLKHLREDPTISESWPGPQGRVLADTQEVLVQ